MKPLFAILLALAVAGCGGRQTLAPAAGQALPPKPATAAVQSGVADLLTPSQTARPQRSDELLRRSEERQDDRFDLPPPG